MPKVTVRYWAAAKAAAGIAEEPFDAATLAEFDRLYPPPKRKTPLAMI